MNFMRIKINDIEITEPVLDFFKIRTKEERWLYSSIPIIIGIITYFFINYCTIIKKEFKLDAFFSDYLNAQITVMALFVSFSMAYLTILITSTSENITDIKLRESKKYKINENPVFLFQILLVDITYTVVVEIFLLALSFIQKFLAILSNDVLLMFYLSFDVILLTHIIFLLLRNLKNVYFTFWNPK